jgi:predicted TIM-barrel fold metal-dependent hydrolase
MKIYDSHLHLNESMPLLEAFKFLSNKCESAGVLGGLIIHLNNPSWNPKELEKILLDHPNYVMAINPNLNSTIREIKKDLLRINPEVCKAIKIHPRIQKIELTSKSMFQIAKIAEEMNLPIIICSFDDGSWSRFGLKTDQFLTLADEFPNVKFLWAHSGGHRILEFMFMARRTENVYLDSSYTQTYFFKGSVLSNLNYAIDSLPSRFMFGTDFEQLEYVNAVNKLVNFYDIENWKKELFFSENYLNFFGLHA